MSAELGPLPTGTGVTGAGDGPPALPPGPEGEQLQLMIHEVQLLLAEKRTSLAVIRTGIAVAALPLTVVGLLIATSRLYDVLSMETLLIPLLVVCAAMVLLGLTLMVRGFGAMHQQDRLIQKLKRTSPRLSEWVP